MAAEALALTTYGLPPFCAPIFFGTQKKPSLPTLCTFTYFFFFVVFSFLLFECFWGFYQFSLKQKKNPPSHPFCFYRSFTRLLVFLYKEFRYHQRGKAYYSACIYIATSYVDIFVRRAMKFWTFCTCTTVIGSRGGILLAACRAR